MVQELTNNQDAETQIKQSTVSSSNVQNLALFYRREMEQARDKQRQYINTLPDNVKNTVQSSIAALTAKSNELILNNPQDEMLIREIYDELALEYKNASNDSKVMTEKETNYRNELIQARQKQQNYINSLPKQQQQYVQTTLQSIIAKANELKIKYPNDTEVIDKVLQELTE